MLLALGPQQFVLADEQIDEVVEAIDFLEGNDGEVLDE